MKALLFDEDLKGPLTDALRRMFPSLTMDRVQDIGMSGRDGWIDADILEWAGAEGRLVISHDRNTMTPIAYDRLTGLPFHGLIIVDETALTARVLEDLQLLIETPIELWDSPVAYVPIR